MLLEKVVIDNFRSIGHAEYDLSRVNLFTGPNMTGKTNTILAIYWAMTGFLLDGSSDDMSLKTIGHTEKPVTVELKFNEFTLKKQYAENWVKTRGSNEFTMQGHYTDYWIDGIKMGANEAKKAIAKKFQTAGHDTGKFDLIRAMVDPYYVGKGVEWKILRKFIIELCGDVKPDDIFAAHPELSVIADRLRTDGYDEAKTTKYYKQLAKSDKEQVDTYRKQIEGLNSMLPPSEDDVAMAKKAIEVIDEKIRDVKSGNGYTGVITSLQAERKEAELKLRECKLADIERAGELNKMVNDQIEAIEIQINDVKKIADTFAQEYQEAKSETEGSLLRLSGLQIQLQAEEDKRESLYKEYDRLAEAKLPDEVICPHCGKPINEDVINQAREQNQKAIDECVARGKKTAANIENLQLKIDELKSRTGELKAAQDKCFKDVSEAENRENQLAQKKRELIATRVSPTDSEETTAAKRALAELDDKISAAYAANSNQNEEEQRIIADLKSKKITHQQTLNAQAAYDQAQERIKELDGNIASLQNHLIKTEEALILITEYTKARLDMFKEHIASVFNGRVEFTLIEQNIKEGSWNEVCYPLILDKETPFTDGSGSEQIITGIYMGDCIKRALALPDLPYIFDECDKLDGAHLAAIDTTAQLISTVVDDRNYSKVTLVTND